MAKWQGEFAGDSCRETVEQTIQDFLL